MDKNSKQLLQKVLHDNGYSMTTARQIVCEALWRKEPLSVTELTQSLGGQIDRASMYRTILLFEKLGLINRVYIGWKYKIELSDVFSNHHHHISCLTCGKIKAIHEEEDIEQLIQSLADNYGISAVRHQLEIQGHCEQCQKLSGASSS
jgi:Fe2+ or Zn2+ uptake regulation protein